jgi:hypothetical protein
MSRTVVTIADELTEGIERYRRSQDPAPDLTAVVNAAVREYLVERGYIPSARVLRITLAEKGSGYHDVSVEHDRHFAERDE